MCAEHSRGLFGAFYNNNKIILIMDTNNTDNNKISFEEPRISESDRYQNAGWGAKVARWVVQKSDGAIKTEQEANNYLIIASIVIIIVGVLIAMFVGK